MTAGSLTSIGASSANACFTSLTPSTWLNMRSVRSSVPPKNPLLSRHRLLHHPKPNPRLPVLHKHPFSLPTISFLLFSLPPDVDDGQRLYMSSDEEWRRCDKRARNTILLNIADLASFGLEGHDVRSAVDVWSCLRLAFEIQDPAVVQHMRSQITSTRIDPSSTSITSHFKTLWAFRDRANRAGARWSEAEFWSLSSQSFPLQGPFGPVLGHLCPASPLSLLKLSSSPLKNTSSLTALSLVASPRLRTCLLPQLLSSTVVTFPILVPAACTARIMVILQKIAMKMGERQRTVVQSGGQGSVVFFQVLILLLLIFLVTLLPLLIHLLPWPLALSRRSKMLFSPNILPSHPYFFSSFLLILLILLELPIQEECLLTVVLGLCDEGEC